MKTNWDEVVEAVYYRIQFEPKLDDSIVDWIARLLVNNPCRNLTPPQEYDAIARGVLFGEPFPASIPTRHTTTELRDFLSKIVRRMDEMRPWPQPAVTSLPDSELPRFSNESPAAEIEITVDEFQQRIYRTFKPHPKGGFYLLLGMQNGAVIGLFAPPDRQPVYAMVTGTYASNETDIYQLILAINIAPSRVTRMVLDSRGGDYLSVLEGRDPRRPPVPPWLTEVNDSISLPSDPRLQRAAVTSREEAQALLGKVFAHGREFRTLECKHGWVAQAILTDAEISSGAGLGLGNYVLNKKTGAVTAHASLPSTMIGEQFDAAIEAGERVAGYQVYPPLRRIHLQRASEDSRSISYRVEVARLDRPGERMTIQQVKIVKSTLGYTPTDSVSSHVVAWAEMRHRTTGVWPMEGTFDQ
ncbi:hypothetical protein [Nocardia sp. No.11]|uniref:hypothetical protein n=1 Tax=Nocardia sp. No.11 TaxID=3128861 RepID=UPI00319DC314